MRLKSAPIWMAMSNFTEVTDEDLARARKDPAFRHKLISDNLEVLLLTLHRLRSQPTDRAVTRQIRDGVNMAVKLAELLQTIKVDRPTKAA